MIRGITFVGIPVADQDVALQFYTESLGFKVVTDRPFTASQRWIELLVPGADTGVAFIPRKATRIAPGNFSPSRFGVTTCSQHRPFKSKGVVFAQDPKKEPWGSTALIMGPNGNQFALSSKGTQR